MEGVLVNVRRRDAEVQTLVARARHVVLYRLQRAGTGGKDVWVREPVEGALWVGRRAEGSFPPYSLVVLNLKSPTDVTELLGPDWDAEFSQRFMIYRRRGEIKAVWFAEEGASAGEEDSMRVPTGFDAVREAVERAAYEARRVPPVPVFVSSAGKLGDAEHLTKDALRDVMFHLLNSDQFMETLYVQYVESERKRTMQGLFAGVSSQQQQQQQRPPLPQFQQPQPQQPHPMFPQQQQPAMQMQMQMPMPPPQHMQQWQQPSQPPSMPFTQAQPHLHQQQQPPPQQAGMMQMPTMQMQMPSQLPQGALPPPMQQQQQQPQSQQVQGYAPPMQMMPGGPAGMVGGMSMNGANGGAWPPAFAGAGGLPAQLGPGGAKA